VSVLVRFFATLPKVIKDFWLVIIGAGLFPFTVIVSGLVGLSLVIIIFPDAIPKEDGVKIDVSMID
jgi:hypothetical protein